MLSNGWWFRLCSKPFQRTMFSWRLCSIAVIIGSLGLRLRPASAAPGYPRHVLFGCIGSISCWLLSAGCCAFPASQLLSSSWRTAAHHADLGTTCFFISTLEDLNSLVPFVLNLSAFLHFYCYAAAKLPFHGVGVHTGLLNAPSISLGPMGPHLPHLKSIKDRSPTLTEINDTKQRTNE